MGAIVKNIRSFFIATIKDESGNQREYLKDEVAWHKDKRLNIDKMNKVIDKQMKKRAEKKAKNAKAKNVAKFGKMARGKDGKPLVKNNRGVKRKGRLPAKKIINKLGNVQTVYYRPDEKTKSMYIDPAKMTDTDTVLQYRDSFKRMLFMDHDGIQNQIRDKGGDQHAQGNAMIEGLDKLADKYGFTPDNFDQKQGDFVKRQPKEADKFLEDAEKIYEELYKQGDHAPSQFLSRIFSPTKRKIHSKHAGEKLNQAIDNISPHSIARHKRPIRAGEQKPFVRPKEKGRGFGGRITQVMRENPSVLNKVGANRAPAPQQKAAPAAPKPENKTKANEPAPKQKPTGANDNPEKKAPSKYTPKKLNISQNQDYNQGLALKNHMGDMF